MINKLKTNIVIKPVVLIGNPAEQIVEYSMNKNFDMVVMGNRGLSDIKGMMMGSVSRRVRRLIKCTFVPVSSRLRWLFESVLIPGNCFSTKFESVPKQENN